MAIAIGLSPDTKANASISDLATAASAAGFTSMGLEAALVDRDTATTLSDAGLRCHEVIALLVGEDEDAAIADARRLAGAASAVNAPWVLTACVSPFTPKLAGVIKRCATVLEDAGTGMAVELSPLSPVASIPAALAVVDAADMDRAGVLIDSWNLLKGDDGWDDLATIPLDRIAYVQFADALEPVSDKMMHETLNRRALPGEGLLDLRRFAGTLRDRGWDGLVSAEVLSGELRELPVQEFAQLAYDSTVRYWLD